MQMFESWRTRSYESDLGEDLSGLLLCCNSIWRSLLGIKENTNEIFALREAKAEGDARLRRKAQPLSRILIRADYGVTSETVDT